MRLTSILFAILVAIACTAQEEETPSQPVDGAYKGNSSFVVSAEAPADESNPDELSFASLSDQFGVLLPAERVQADMYTLTAGERAQALMAKFKGSLAEHQQWWIEYVQAHASEPPPVPYHPNMGLTEAEYEEMLTLVEKTEMRKTGEASLLFLNRQNGRVEIFSRELSSHIGVLTVDFQNGTVDTPYGQLQRRENIDNQDPNSPTGAWSGPSWKLEEIVDDGPFGTIVQLALGRRSIDGRGVLYYKVQRIIPDQQPERLTLFLVYGDS